MGPAQVVYSSKFGAKDFVPLPRPRPDGHKPRLLYVGRIAPEKGLEVLLEALRILVRKEAGPAAPVLTLVGSDLMGSTYGDDFRRRVEASDLANYVKMVGYVPYGERLFKVYDEHDALVLPSYSEGFPQVLLEAMIRGLPVVCTAVGGIPKLIRDGQNGVLTPSGDAQALASALLRVLADPNLRNRLSREGQALARGYTSEAQAGVVESFIRQCFPGIRLKTPCQSPD
jgi:glycosyltransferase involved in cell wall biosynthesis